MSWGEGVHEPARQENGAIRVAAGVATVWDVLAARYLEPPLAPEARGVGERLHVVAIGGVAESAGHRWVYRIDGAETPVGPDAYVLRGGERIEWEYVPAEGAEQM